MDVWYTFSMKTLIENEYIKHDEGITLRIDENPFCSGKHSHGFMELVLVLEGKAEHIVSSSSTMVKKGDVFIIDMGAPHYYKRMDEDCKILNCLFSPSFLERISFDGTGFEDFAIKIFTDSVSSELPYPIVKSRSSKQIAGLLVDMFDEYEKKREGYVKVLCSYLAIVLVLFSRNSFLPTTADRRLVDDIKSIIASTGAKEVSVEKISNALFFSPSYVSKIFKKHTGEDLSAFIRKNRIHTASDMLINSNLSIEKIMYEVGYKDKKNFYDIFEKEFGQTPSAYRKQNKKDVK